MKHWRYYVCAMIHLCVHPSVVVAQVRSDLLGGIGDTTPDKLPYLSKRPRRFDDR